jgi:EmrB/QacA subfamily drug resistance transporter
MFLNYHNRSDRRKGLVHQRADRAAQKPRRTLVVPSEHHASVRPGLVLTIVALVQFLISVDLSIVNVALPRIGVSLAFSPVGLTWVINAYALTFGGLLLLGGKAADRYGRKPVLFAGLGLFGAASLAGGLAHAPATLVTARAVQGIGAAALAPAALSLLTATFPAGRARVRAFGVWSAVNAAGGAFGVVAGGVLTQYAGWRSVMFVNTPLVAVVLALAARGVTHDQDRSRPTNPPDVLGGVLVTAGIGLLVLGVVRTDRYAWTSPVTLVTLGGAAATLLLFVQVERATKREPLLRLGLLGNRTVANSNAYNLLLGAVMASAIYFATLYLQRVLGIQPAKAGLMFFPFGLGVITGSVLAVKIGYRFAPRSLLVAGGLVTAAGFGWFGMISANGSFLVDVLGPEVLASVGYGLCLAPVVSLATAEVAPREAGTASALLNSSRQIGASLGLAVLGTIANHHTGLVATARTLDLGYAVGLKLDSAIVAAAAILALIALRPRRATPAPRPTPPIPATAAGTKEAPSDGYALSEHL